MLTKIVSKFIIGILYLLIYYLFILVIHLLLLLLSTATRYLEQMLTKIVRKIIIINKINKTNNNIKLNNVQYNIKKYANKNC